MTEVPFQTLRDRGFRGVIFDKDNTLTVPHKLEIAPHLESSLAECRRVFGDSGVVIFSNSAGSTDDKDGVEAKKIEERLQVAVLRHNQKVINGCGVDAWMEWVAELLVIAETWRHCICQETFWRSRP